MNEVAIYRPNNRKMIWIAFACAITIHLAAIGLAKNKPQRLLPVASPFGTEVDVTDFPNPPQEEPEIVVPPEQTLNHDDFTDENATRPPVHPRKKTPVTAVPRSTGIDAARTMGFGSAKALAVYAPRPNYPYEARRGRITGSGIAQLTVNVAAGNVIEARMSQSTGSPILDKATLEALRRWRFKSGVAENVDVPITFTLTGVSY